MRSDRPSITARWVAAQRTRLHNRRPASPAGDAAAELRLYRGFGRLLGLAPMRPTAMAMRTSFIDDEVVDALAGGIDQIVIVGAGYDGRALRFSTPGVRWFEVDHPATQPDKQRRLAAAGASTDAISFLAVDLLRDDLSAALDVAGHAADRPTLFICEGLFTYLPNPVGAQLCTTLRARAAAGSGLTANFLVIARRSHPGMMTVLDGVLGRIGEHRQGIYGIDDAQDMLANTGWSPRRQQTSASNPLAGRSHLLLVAADPA